MKCILLFLITNVAILLVLGIVVRLLMSPPPLEERIAALERAG